jgi:hypothetical protein
MDAEMICNYSSGEEIRVGDRVFTANEKWGVVAMIIAPNSEESVGFDCPHGGVMIREDWDGEPNPILYTDQDSFSHDISFIGREIVQDDSNKP